MKKNNEIDVHNLTVDEALKVVNSAIASYYKYGEQILYIVHGFNKGSKIKERLKTIKSNFVRDIKEDPINPGRTIIYLKMKIF